jgi:hypothetical protein
MTGRSYVNNLVGEDGRKVHEVWGANYRRLVSVKGALRPRQCLPARLPIDLARSEALARSVLTVSLAAKGSKPASTSRQNR